MTVPRPWPALERLLARQPCRATSVDLLRAARTSPRAAVRITLESDVVLKARRLASADAAAWMVRLADLAPVGVLAPVLDVEDDTVLEAWVDGPVVAGRTDRVTEVALVRELGQLLGRVASTEVPVEGARPRTSPVDIGVLRRGVQWLLAHDVLGEREAQAIDALAARACPVSTEYGLVHYDVAPDNVVRQASGALVLIDNESLRIGPLDLDLARTLSRWRLPAQAREAFLDGYRLHRSTASFGCDEDYWTLLSLVGSLQFVVQEDVSRVEAVRERLRAHVAEANGRTPSPQDRLLLGTGSRCVALTVTPDDREWLLESVGPWLVRDHATPVRAEIVAATPGPHVVPAGPLDGREVPTWTMDGAGGSFVARTFRDGAGTLEHPDRRLRLHVVPPCVHVEAIDRDLLRVALLRLARELTLHDEVGVCLHGAAFVSGGLGVVALGPKRSGKTSLLLQALAEGAGYVANDRLLLHEQEGRLRCHGIPTVVAIRPTVLARTPAAAARLAARPLWYCHTEAECDAWMAREGTPLVDDAAPTLTPRQLCTIFGATPHADLDPSVLLFPGITPTARGIEVQRLDAADTLERLRGALLGADARPEALRWDEPTPVDRMAWLERLAARAPAYALSVGPDAWDEPRPVARLLSALNSDLVAMGGDLSAPECKLVTRGTS